MKKRFILVMILLLGMVTTSNAELRIIGTATYNGAEYNLIYDDDNNGKELVWLDYTNPHAYWSDQVDWAASLNGDGVLDVKLNCGVTIDWTDVWRLPTAVHVFPPKFGWQGPDDKGIYAYTFGYNLQNGELGHLFYSGLENLAFYGPDAPGPGPDGYAGDGNFGLNNTGVFDNLKSAFYWTGTEFVLPSGPPPGGGPPGGNGGGPPPEGGPGGSNGGPPPGGAALPPPANAYAFGMLDGFQHFLIQGWTFNAIAVCAADVTISDCPAPSICEILAFFKESVENGDLKGSGCGWYAKRRLCYMKKMLKMTKRSIEEDNAGKACRLLKRLYKRCDGQKRPSDFVAGDATEVLADMIYAFAESLGFAWLENQ